MWMLLLLGIGLTTAQTVTDDGIPVCQPDEKDVAMQFYLTVVNISCLSLLCLVLIINIHKKLNAKPIVRKANEPSIDSFDMGLYATSTTRSVYPISEEVPYNSGSISPSMMHKPEFISQPMQFDPASNSYVPMPTVGLDSGNMQPHYMTTVSRNFSQSPDQVVYEVPRTRKISMHSVAHQPMYSNAE